MPERKFLQAGGAAIVIESSGAAVAGDPALAPKFVAALQAMAKTLGEGLKDLKDGRPDEVGLSFHLGVSGDRFLILQGEASANFTVSFKWGGGPVSQAKSLVPSPR